MLKSTTHVYVLHFREDNIETHYQVTLPGGVWKQERERPRLKPSATPSKYLSSNKRKRKPTSRNKAITEGRKNIFYKKKKLWLSTFSTGSVLHHLIIECVMLLENTNFYVHNVTTEGAS
ncbi:uncharacterized protein [Parasteatoda tepidariorum]|uniref:uncharacterized protein isoform X2 n=1 Tax=Parasteatoda tepidariorum TaxID=114398 RepID=UPI001C727EB4|nr:uncharacterized protein LOC122269593 isoform X1 [Parasteatoda tepidariorum]